MGRKGVGYRLRKPESIRAGKDDVKHLSKEEHRNC